MADRQQLAPGEERVVTVPDLSNVVTVTAGDAHDCALTRDREVVCWGQNGSGQLGDGSFEARERPVKVAGLAGVIQVAAGHGFTCALTEGGSVSCWGDAGNCVVGAARVGCEKRTLGSTMGPVEVELCPKPQPITLPFAATSIAVGSGTGCARDAKGHVACWGRSLTHDPGGCVARAYSRAAVSSGRKAHTVN
jgi:alpha-tubulin suppressor-like RCC1 family protein